jgi:hemerythrin-like domain-containing protein
MSDPIAMLTREHRVIEKVLGALETFAERLGTEGVDERTAVREFASFFRDYVDMCHHGKEEDYLFIKMTSHGFSRDSGPLGAMLSEQGEGREHLAALRSVSEGSGPLNRDERELVRGHALAYIMRIGPHIRREDAILFPMVSRSLPATVLAELAREFERFDRQLADSGLLGKLHEAADRLQRAFPPDPSRSPSSYLAADGDPKPHGSRDP